MGRWTGSWLEGPAAAGYGPDLPADYQPGQRLGLPGSGPGSVAPVGQRVAALLLDLVACGLIGRALLGDPQQAGAWRSLWVPNAVFAADYVVFVSLVGQSFGMRLLGLRVARVGADRLPWWLAVVIRTALLVVLVPAVVYDVDRRGLHDKLSGTAVVRR